VLGAATKTVATLLRSLLTHLDTVCPHSTLARTAQSIYGGIGRRLMVEQSDTGEGTDAAFAAVSGKPAIAESFGLIGFGCHSSVEEYVALASIASRLYLLVWLIMETPMHRS